MKTAEEVAKEWEAKPFRHASKEHTRILLVDLITQARREGAADMRERAAEICADVAILALPLEAESKASQKLEHNEEV